MIHHFGDLTGRHPDMGGDLLDQRVGGWLEIRRRMNERHRLTPRRLEMDTNRACLMEFHPLCPVFYLQVWEILCIIVGISFLIRLWPIPAVFHRFDPFR